MNTVTVNKADLIAKVKANRDEHRGIFEIAVVKYREAVLEQLDARIEEIRAGKPISLRFTLPAPEDFTDEYDMALEQMNWEVGDKVELDQQTFRELVLNQWRWADRFYANTQSYVG